MKKLVFLLCTLVLMSILVVSGCGQTSSTTSGPASSSTSAPPPSSSATTKPPATTSSFTPTTGIVTSTATAGGNYGGNVRILGSNSPTNIGYYATQQFADATVETMWAERILELKTDGSFYPSLCDSYDMSSDLKTVTLHLHDGIKFQDGTDWNADAAVWNFQECLPTGGLGGGSGYITSIEATDPLTVTVKLNAPYNQIIYNLARVYMYSPTAFKEHGKDWAVNNSVSTAAFQVTEFKRDVSVKMVKNPNYWRPGLPYLDSAELIVIKDSATALALMEAGQADGWMISTPQETQVLAGEGFQIVQTPTTYRFLYPDSINPDSPFAKKEVREAVEYAIDRPALAKAVGFGYVLPLDQPAHKGSQGYNPDYPVRAYDPAKAIQMLADAGYPKGFKTKLTGQAATDSNALALIQSYLAAVGIQADIDLVDVGRFWGEVNDGWDGLFYGFMGINPQFCVAWLDHVGPHPMMAFAGMAKSQAYLDLCAKVVTAPDVPAMGKATQAMVTQFGEDELAIPLIENLGTSVFVPSFHTGYFTYVDWTYWDLYNDYWEK
jgi:peptide/nickel transport system substrate-binding protein